MGVIMLQVVHQLQFKVRNIKTWNKLNHEDIVGLALEFQVPPLGLFPFESLSLGLSCNVYVTFLRKLQVH